MLPGINSQNTKPLAGPPRPPWGPRHRRRPQRGPAPAAPRSSPPFSPSQAREGLGGLALMRGSRRGPPRHKQLGRAGIGRRRAQTSPPHGRPRLPRRRPLSALDGELRRRAPARLGGHGQGAGAAAVPVPGGGTPRGPRCARPRRSPLPAPSQWRAAAAGGVCRDLTSGTCHPAADRARDAAPPPPALSPPPSRGQRPLGGAAVAAGPRPPRPWAPSGRGRWQRLHGRLRAGPEHERMLARFY